MLLFSCGGALHGTVECQWKIKQMKKKKNSNGKNKNKDKSKIPLSLFLISECLEKVREMSRKGFDKVAGGG